MNAVSQLFTVSDFELEIKKIYKKPSSITSGQASSILYMCVAHLTKHEHQGFSSAYGV